MSASRLLRLMVVVTRQDDGREAVPDIRRGGIKTCDVVVAHRHEQRRFATRKLVADRLEHLPGQPPRHVSEQVIVAERGSDHYPSHSGVRMQVPHRRQRQVRQLPMLVFDSDRIA